MMKKQKINLKFLDNGIPVLYETLSHTRSVSFKVLVNVGSRNERDDQRGMAHFIEHMMFKGTRNLSAFDIANTIEKYGGHFNAYTSKEETVYLAKIIDEQLSSTINVFFEMLAHSNLDSADIDQEKGVVIEEINGTHDAPDDIIWDYFTENLLDPDDSGKPTLGSKKSVRSFTQQGLKEFWQTHYNANNITIAVAGGIESSQLINELNSTFGKIHQGTKTKNSFLNPVNLFDKNYDRDIEQIHLLLGKKVCEFTHDDRLKLVLVNNILGGGMSSRLFQQIREKHGLAYSVYSALDFMSDHGISYHYIASDKKNYQSSIDLTLKEIEKIYKSEITKSEVIDAKTQLKGALLLSMENNSQRVDKMLKHYTQFGDFFDIDALINYIENISFDDVIRVSNAYFAPESFSIAKIGALN